MDTKKADEIHRLRIAGKKLRYALEIFAVALPVATQTGSLDALETLQETLGTFTDHAAAADRFRRWAREDGLRVFITIHPSFILRIPDPADKEAERARFLRDMREVRTLMA